jgi:predicted DNA-binding protein YlxM (UPF0122 family)
MNDTLYTKATCSCNTCKILEYLIEGRDFDYTISQIAEELELSRTAVRNSLKKLMKEKKAYSPREKYYKVTPKHPCIEVFDFIIKKRLLQ